MVQFYKAVLFIALSLLASSCMLSADISKLSETGNVSTSPLSQKVYFDQTQLSLVEGAAAIVSVQLTEKLPTDLVVSLAVSGDTAIVASYPANVIITAGSLSKSVTIQLNDDFVFTGQKTVIFKMSPDTSDVIAQPDSLTISISDNDLPTLTLTQSSLIETEDTKAITLTAMLNAVSPNAVSVPLIVSGTATSALDFTISSATLSIPAGQTSGSVTIQIIEDADYETDETVIVSLGTPTNASLGATTSFTLTITNDDLGAFTISGITGSSDSTADAFLVAGLVATVNWTASSGATSYSVKILASNGTTEICAAQTTTSLQLTFTGCTLTAGQTYKASVESILGSISYPASNSLYSFYVNSNPVANSDGPVRIMKGTTNVTLNVVSGSDSAARGTVADSDPDVGDSISITAVTQGSAGGAVTFTATTLTYAPASASFNGIDTFSYTISDLRGATATATVTVHVMDTFTWTGKISSAWGTSGNWCGTSISNNQCVGGGAPNSSADSSHVAVFDGTCSSGTHTCNANISTAISIYGVKLSSTYSGSLKNISGGSISLTDTFIQSGGSFEGGANALSFPRFALSGGSFKSTSNTLKVISSFTVSNAPTFDANNGTLLIEEANNYSPSTVVPGNIELYDVILRRGYASGIGLTGTMKILNTLTCDDPSATGGINGGTIELKGNLVGTNGGCHGDTVIKLVGATNQTVTSVSTASFPGMNINSTATVTFVGTSSIRSNFIYTSGTVDMGTSKIVFWNPSGYSPGTVEPGPIRFNDVEISRGYSSSMTLASPLYVDGNLICNGVGTGGNSFEGSTVEVKGNITFSNFGCHGSSTVYKLVGVNQSVTGSANPLISSLTIASTGNVTLTGDIAVVRNFTYISGTVDASTSHLILSNSGGYNATQISPGPIIFNDVSINHGFFSPAVITGTLYVNGTLTCNSDQGGGFENGTIQLAGNLVGLSYGCHSGGATSLILSGTANTSITLASTAYLPMGTITVNKGSGQVSLASNVSTASNFTIQSGTANLNSHALTVGGTLTVNSGATLTVNGGSFTPNTGPSFVNNGTLN